MPNHKTETDNFPSQLYIYIYKKNPQNELFLARQHKQNK